MLEIIILNILSLLAGLTYIRISLGKDKFWKIAKQLINNQ